MIPATLSVVLQTARTYLNDDNGTTWTDQILIPKAQESFRELQNKLWVAGAQIVRGQNAVARHIVAGAVPTVYTQFDMQSPIAMYEAAWPTALPWIPMTEINYFPADFVPGITITYWSWQEEVLYVAPCNVDRSVILNYRLIMPVPTVAGSSLTVPFAELYMGARTAAIAAGSVGNAEVFAAMSAKAKENLGKVITANRGQSKPSLRP
jgi:hypothetical protein